MKILTHNSFKLRLTLIVLLILFPFTKSVENIFSFKGNINMFHLGEKISPSIDMLMFNKKPISEIFVLHGYFIEVLESMIAFKISGISIGSYLFWDTIISMLAYLLFFLLTNYFIKHTILFLLINIFFIGTQLRLRVVNNLIFFIFIFISVIIIKRKKPSTLLYFLQSFLVFIDYFYAIEQAYYSTITLVVLVLFRLLIILKNKSLDIKNQLFKLLIGSFGGFIASIVIGIYLVGRGGLFKYLNDVFFIPRLGYMIFKPEFPSFSLQSFFPYYLPFVIVAINLIFLLYLFKMNYYKNLPVYIFIFFIGLMHFIGILARSNIRFIDYDKANINYYMWPMFLSLFIFIDLLLNKVNKLSYKIFFILIFFPLLLPFFNYKHLLFTRNSLSSIKQFFNLPKYDDEFWISLEQRRVKNFIINNTNSSDYVYVFNDESLYYYLFKRSNPSRYYISALSEPYTTQLEVIQQLITNKPKYVIYHSKYWSNNLDDIPQAIRLSQINEWILKNYRNSIRIDDTIILY